MFASSVARIIRTRATNRSLLCHRRHHNGALGSILSSATLKRRRCISSPAIQQICQQHQHHLFSTTATATPTASSATSATPPDNLPASATTGTIGSHNKPIPTERDIAVSGGVWALTSRKRDKLGELKGALGEEHDTLDDVATEEELLDLHLADGIKLIAKVTDAGLDFTKNDSEKGNDMNMAVLNEFSTWLDNQHDPSLPDDVNRTALEIKLELLSAKIDKLLETIPPDHCLRSLRDFLDPVDISKQVKDYDEDENLFSSNNDNDTFSMDTSSFEDAVTRFRLLLVKSAIDQVLQSWKILMTVSDADIDRAATEGIALQSELDTLSLSKVIVFLQKNVSGSCSDRVTAAWDLMDRDQDGCLDEKEMNEVVHLCLGIEVKALQAFFEETLDAFPVRAPLSAIESDDEVPAPQGWRQRRAEKNTKKRLIKMFQECCKKRFDVEVEINHRLRCIYAWANKADQDNQLKSVLVDDQAGWSGRKRYVELSPKISESEFREVQEIHFKHLDRLGTELVTGFREDLWVLQGKGRERKDLIRNGALFLTAVSLVDFGIYLL